MEKVTAPNGSEWSVYPSPTHYGRPPPAGREYWAHRMSGESPSSLRGVVGFYASSKAEIIERLSA